MRGIAVTRLRIVVPTWFGRVGHQAATQSLPPADYCLPDPDAVVSPRIVHRQISSASTIRSRSDSVSTLPLPSIGICSR